MDSSPKLDPILAAILDSGRHTKHRVHSPHVRPSLDRNGEFVRLHRGSYLPKRRWSALSFEDRHLATMLSAQRAAARPLVFSRLSAAILLGLSMYEPRDTRVHVVTSESGAGKTSAGIVRHRCSIDSADIVSAHGLLCTSPFRTVLDLARFEPAELALAAADSYLRQEYRVGRNVDSNGVEEWRNAFADQLSHLAGHRGVRLALQVCELADARCDSVLESVSHLQCGAPISSCPRLSVIVLSRVRTLRIPWQSCNQVRAPGRSCEAECPKPASPATLVCLDFGVAQPGEPAGCCASAATLRSCAANPEARRQPASSS